MKVKNLKLIAKTEEDLRVIAAHQDAIANVSEIANLKKKNFFFAVKQVHVGRCRKRCI